MENTIFREALCSVFPTKYYSGNHINKIGKGGACDKCGERKRCIESFGGETCWKETICKT
jgi:hypothetical protein